MEKLKNILKYLISFGLAAGLILYVYRDTNMDALWKELALTNYWWIALSFAAAIIAHLSRAIRWQMLLQPMGYNPNLFNTFYAVMVGYAANSVIPRAGELSRCGMLYKSDQIPVDKSLGTVVAERLIDLITMALVMLLTFIIEFDTLFGFVNQLLGGDDNKSKIKIIIILISIVCIPLGIWIFNKIKNKLYQIPFVKGLLEGITSIKNCKNPILFIFHSLLIWLCYYLMMYFALRSMPSTEHLNMVIALSILMISTLGIIVPVPGGIGAYHFLVTEGLFLYGVSKIDSSAFAGISHSLQILEILILSGLCFILNFFINKNKIKNGRITN